MLDTLFWIVDACDADLAQQTDHVGRELITVGHCASWYATYQEKREAALAEAASL